MNDSFTPENFGENHITEIKEPVKKEKKQKTRFPVSAFVIILIVCILVSSVSGAGGAFFMYNLLYSAPSAEEATKQEFVIAEETTQSSAVPEVLATEEYAESTQQTEENTFMPAISEAETVTVTVTEVQTTVVYQETTTATPSLSKGDIYADAVNSIFAITSSWKEYYSSWLGSYYRPATSTGTGFAISDNGYIITNYHVVENAEDITVTDYNGKEYPAELIGSEPSNDIAIIKINENTVSTPLGNSSDLKVGDDIMVIGNALGELSYTFTDGIVSHLSRSVTLESGRTINMFQTNAAINNGNSGGPVYNMNGEVVGIASAKYASESIEGLGFCIPIDDIKTMMSDIILYGFVRGKPTLGISVQTVTSSMSSRYSIPTGCYIVALDKTSPCYEAGMRSGDVITKIGSKTISECADIESILSSKKAGDNLSITYYSEGEAKTVNISLAELKPSEARTNYSNVYDY